MARYTNRLSDGSRAYFANFSTPGVFPNSYNGSSKGGKV